MRGCMIFKRLSVNPPRGIESETYLCNFSLLRQRMLLTVLLVSGLSGCSLFGSKEPEKVPPPISPQLRDVPYSARDFKMEEPRRRVFVLPFLYSLGENPGAISQAARDGFVDQLVRTRQFVILNNNDLASDFSKMVDESLEYNISEFLSQAEKTGAAAIIEGKVLEIRARKSGDPVGVFRKTQVRVDASIRIRVISASSGREILNVARTNTIETSSTSVGANEPAANWLDQDPSLVREAVSKGFQALVPDVTLAVRKLAWEGRIAQVNGDRIYINAGRVSGLQVGDILKVLDQGEPIFDPATGVLIGRAPGRMKGTLEIVNYFGQDGSVTVVHSGANFQKNDVVEMY